MTLPEWPITLIDIGGSLLMIVFAFLCVHLAGQLRRRDEENVVWTYLLWLCYALAGFAISRAAGHITKHVSFYMDHGRTWAVLRPYSGAINTIMFVVVASITLFFERVWQIYQQIMKGKENLQETHEQVLYLNRHLEDLVEERTRKLAQSEGKYRRIFEVSRDMIAVVDPRGYLLDMNPFGLELLAIPDRGVRGGTIFFPDFFTDKRVWDHLRQQLSEQGYVSDAELDLVAKDQRIVNVLLSATAETSAAKGTQRFHFLVKDISQRKVMVQQLLQADKLASIGQLAAGIAHEINNPLSIILGYTQLLIRSEEQSTERYDDLRTIEKHTRACKTIVQDLLNFSRSTRTKKSTSSLHDAVNEVLNVVRHHFSLDNVAIETEFDQQIPPMVLDKEKIEQVFMNLVMNAKQAIGENGTIRIISSFDKDHNRVIVKVEDTGNGIDPKHLPRIFDPFFTTKKTGEGTGLGLSVSYGIVQHHNGEILVESEPGQGTTFTVILPLTTEAD